MHRVRLAGNMAYYFARSRRLIFVAVALVAAAAAAAPRKTSLSDVERKKIEALIINVENLDGAVFVRNGKAYPPSAAAKFLRAKWQKQASRISTAEEFIAQVATASSTTGRVYMVRFTNGREITASAFLRARLAALR